MSKDVTKPKNKTIVLCTDTNSKVKAVIVKKDEKTLVVDLPTGFQMTLSRINSRRPYAWRIGTMEFISDGWEQS
jgi:hypothetical protein